MIFEVLLGINIFFLLISIGLSYFYYRQNYLVLKDNADAFKLLVEFLHKNLEKNFSDHEQLVKVVTDNDEKVVAALTENDQKIVNLIVEEQKNIVNLAYFLGYRPKNLEDL
jgi:hypothetical protein